MKKKFLSILLAICMIISLTPAAFATDAIVTEGSNESLLDNGATTNDIGIKLGSADSAKVAKVGDNEYDTLQAAIDAIDTSGEVDILTNIALSEGVTIAADKTVTLDLNGNIISRNTDAAVSSAAITNNGNLTIQDSSTEKSGKITAFAANPDTAEIPYYANNTITNCGVLTIKSGTIENSTSDAARAAYPIDNNSTSRDAIANIEGGIITGRGAIRQFANSKTSKNEVNITGGTVTGTSYGIWVQNPGDNDPKAALNISGEANVAKVLLSSSANFAVAISSGTISEVTSWEPDTTNTSRNPSAFITGGTFSVDPSEYVAPGYETADSGSNYTVTVKSGMVATNSKGAYDTVTEAIQKASDGDTVYLLPGTISEYIAPWAQDSTHASEKSITIIGSENYGTTLTGGMYLGYDDSKTRDHSITVSGIVFQNKGLTVFDQKNVLIENNKFSNITGSAILVSDLDRNSANGSAVIKNNLIDTASGAGIEVRRGHDITVTSNTVANTDSNSVLLSGSVTGDAVVSANTLSNWGLADNDDPKDGMLDGRALRVVLSNGTITATNNSMATSAAPEQFVKVSGPGTIDVSGNYWNGADPTGTYVVGEETYPYFTTDSNVDTVTAIKNYYTDSAKTNLVTCGVAEINGVGYATLQAAVDAATAGQTVTLLDNIDIDLGNDGGTAFTVAADDSITLDLNGYAITGPGNAVNKSCFLLVNNGTLVIKDSSEAQTGKIQMTTSSEWSDWVQATPVANKGNLTLESGSIIAARGGSSTAMTYAIDTQGAGVTTITGGLVQSDYLPLRAFGNASNPKIVISGNAQVTSTGGKSAIFIQLPGSSPNKAEFEVTGGTISSPANNPIYIWAENEGTVTTTIKGGNWQYSANLDVFYITDDSAKFTHTQSITGGTFSSDPGDYVAQGYRSVKIGDKFVVIPKTQFVITFQPNGGNFDAATSFTGDGATLAELLKATHSNGNYTFKGWFTAASGGEQVTTDTVFTGDTTIYAQWIDNTPSSGGGGGRNPAPSTPAPEPEVNTPSVDTNAPVVDSTTTENTDGSTTTTDTLENGVVVETTTNTDGSTTETATKTETVETDEGKTTTTTTTTTTNTDAAGATVTESTEEVKVETSTGTTTTTTTVTESETKTEKTETVEETVIAEDGTETTTTTSTTETALSNGSTGTTTVDAAGNVEAQVTVSSDAVAEAAQAETPVELAMPAVESSTNTEAAATISVTLPEGTASATVAIPVADGTGEGTVAVIVNADGTETVITDSVVTENGLIVEVPDGATVKVVDNATGFTDVADSDWEKDAVDFTSARGIMQGTSGGENATFDPDTTTTRAMVWTMLARMDGVDTTPAEGEDWWAAGQRWAMENGISDGTMHDADVTREQLVTMLHRFVGAPDSDHDISDYHDDHETSDWALTAKKWAVEMGVMQGSDNYLMPKDDATRAQVAQTFMNFIKNV